MRDRAPDASTTDTPGGDQEGNQGSTAGASGQEPSGECERAGPSLVSLPFAAPSFTAAKGVLHAPAELRGNMPPHTRDALLLAIAKARRWVDELARGEASFEDIAAREGKVERHIRVLAPLAFVSPRIIEAVQEGRAALDITVTVLARTLPHSWAEQERRFGV